MLALRPGETKILASRPDLFRAQNETRRSRRRPMLRGRGQNKPKCWPQGQTKVLCIALEVSIMLSKSRSGINNLCLLTRPV